MWKVALFFFIQLVLCAQWNEHWAEAPNVLLYTFHDGTVSELQGVLNVLFNGKAATTLINHEQLKLEPSEIQSQLCDKYTLIIVSDAFYIYKQFFEYIVLGGGCSKTVILLSITNRFDYKVKEREDYLKMMRKMAQLKNVFWAPNNPFELEWLRLAKVEVPKKRTFLCLPIGYHVQIDRKEWPETLKRLTMAASYNSDFWKYSACEHLTAIPEFEENTFLFDTKYGGVEALKEYVDWFYYIPYQFSTMKVYECWRAAVVMVIPSEEMLKQMLREMRSGGSDAFTLPEMEQCIWKEHPNDWQQFWDVYRPENRELVIIVKSYEELRKWIIAKKILGVDLDAYKKKVAERMKEHERVQLKQWKKLMKEMGRVRIMK